MGGSNSKPDKSTALNLCRGRKKFIKQAIDSRYCLAAAHVSYIQSLRNIGIALRKYAESEISADPTQSVDKIPSPHSPYPSHSPQGFSDSPVINGSPLSPPQARASYMRSSGASTLTVQVGPPPRNMYVEEGENEGEFTMPPPPPPPPEMESSWDYFDQSEESFRFVGQNGEFDEVGKDRDKIEVDLDKSRNDAIIEEPPLTPKLQGKLIVDHGNYGSTPEKSGKNREKDVKNGEREDASDFITHRAKDFVSSIRDIDNRFFRASESGKEVSRMLESNKIRVGYADARGASSGSICFASFGGGCCQGTANNVSDDPNVTKVITWKRTTSSRSSSSKNPLATKDDNDDSGSDFVEEFCMISGSHSSSLDRLYAWERKLYDEVKASESLQKEYDRKCDQLRHQFAKDLKAQVIDKTRSVVKDLHSRLRVSLHAVDSISKRIEKMRDEELLPQLKELIQGLIRMWKAMLECHHSQYITISLAYHSKNSPVAPLGETQREAINQLQIDVEYFGLSFADWINSYTSYVESLNSWLQNCILQPQERHRGRRVFSPRRNVAPPIFVLFRDWSVGIKSLPSQEVSDEIKSFLSDIRNSIRNQAEELNRKEGSVETEKNETTDGQDEGKTDGGSSSMSFVQGSLTRVLDRMTKFSEASVKMCEDIRQKCETARNAYDNYRVPPRAFSI